MTRKRDHDHFPDHLRPQKLSSEQYWSSLISGFESGPFGSDPSSSRMSSTTENNIAISTFTVVSTTLRTTYVTVRITTDGVPPNAPTIVLSSSTSSACGTGNSPASTSSIATAASVAPSSREISLTALTTAASSTSLTSTTMSVYTQQPPQQTPSPAAALPQIDSASSTRKHAVVGGLSGSIAGLVLLGLLFCLCLRRRRKLHAEINPDDESSTKQGLRPTLARKWSEWTVGRGSPKPAPITTWKKSPVIEDHMIRMSLDHWSRPFANGEGYRESMPPGALRVTNPDSSRPATPQILQNAAGSFLQRQRGALAAVLLNANRSRDTSRSTTPLPQQPPRIHIDPALSKECIAPTVVTPSFRSYASTCSLPVIQQSPLEDPFLTPPQEEPLPLTGSQQKPSRPSLTPLQSAAGAAGRSLSYLSSHLNPFQTRSLQGPANARSASISTMSSHWSRRDTARSDPFDLDRPSVRGSHSAGGGGVGGEVGREQAPNWRVYEGT